jgi:hypothetical protein
MAGLKLMAELGLDGTGFATGLKRAEGLAAGATRSIANALIGMVGIGTVGLAIHKTVESASELVIASERLGIGVTNLQVLRRAAQDAGVEFSKLERTFEGIDVARRKALTPGKTGEAERRSFAELGINHEMLRTMTAANLFTGPMSQAFKGGNQGQLGPLLAQVTGGVKAVGEIIPVLKMNLEALELAMRKYGAILDTETAVKLKHVNDAFGLLTQIIVTHLGPAIVGFVEYLWKTGAGLAAGFAWLKSYIGDRGGEIAATAGDALLYGIGGISKKDALENAKERESEAVTPKQAAENAHKAALAAFKAVNDPREQWEARMAELAYELDHPKPPEGGGFKGDLPKYSPKAFETPGDSLVKIGNFLGGSQTVLTRMAEQRTNYLRVIAAAVTRSGPAAGQGQQSRMIQAGQMAAFGVFVPHF